MTNLNTAFRASIWMAIAATLMLATFEPITVEAPQIEVAAVAASPVAA